LASSPLYAFGLIVILGVAECSGIDLRGSDPLLFEDMTSYLNVHGLLTRQKSIKLSRMTGLPQSDLLLFVLLANFVPVVLVILATSGKYHTPGFDRVSCKAPRN